ncbi:glucans biosynthesis glucosyltransferase MdoH [Minwuia thermotolerans]|uniref:Glucans biosynthesis glucosyltransferase H n=1 Tax=Minwuia thermotolerans TaxID=2056226 RepID=A0A2M9FXI6_9PROT|nr:glucans biosynthesis glucosyltransferase MdoH [Minwuia thermotolerans]PJK28167.1 glucans biosynthesis glucosyltransferase MdoH [Minwuia thermotolerans]
MSAAPLAVSFVAVSSLAVSAALVAAFGGDGVSAIEALILLLILPLHAMLAAGFVFACLGLWQVESARKRPSAECPTESTGTPCEAGFLTVIAVPVFHEDPAEVFARIRTMYESLRREGRLGGFEFFILSDSRRPEVAAAEERAWRGLCAEVSGHGRIFYRRRPDNRGKKSGNIAEFCQRWGGRYRYMIVLDADSLMTGGAMAEMVERMEADPALGLLQTRPLERDGVTLFARIRQFANSVYGAVFTPGLAAAQGDAAFYWGHNAIMRTEAFAGACGLPELPGQPPLGGPIMSHDFVEAALLRRRGWKVRIETDIDGSYEEGPPSLTDFATRDRRWCQGNLQHARLLPVAGLNWISRANFVLGIMGYVAGPLWFLLLATMTAAALADALPRRAALVDLPVAGDVAVLALTVFYLVGPKLLALAHGLVDRRIRNGHGGGLRMSASVLLEMIFSALLAPILMILYTRFVIEVLTGRSVAWNPQRREADRMRWSEALRQYRWEIAAALGGAALLSVFAPVHFLWLAPVLAGLLLAAPIDVLSGRAASGRATARLGLFLVPHEPRGHADRARGDGIFGALARRH